ncbi:MULTISPECIES: helix-turn-helix transcriptional regulator [Serratia]|uniref:helix-turn-helix transcriptional regulator n=1 Tax=Serratia TaxID=613 RepID=UPI00217A609A|nr:MULTISPECIES: LuxR C-terminal-related transcriptional regulator [Serratia]CAI1786938.1 fimbriae regulatory protein FimW [Serratia proteamaculans]CAI1874630.1 fimbriae regulatory protein FimW [Serratia quinivorans]CAI1975630.1 fimbriae regulatory protein FimW [Serratia quinivorans]
MERSIRISIIDTNRHFGEGLKYALLEYFQVKGRALEILPGDVEQPSADLVFMARSEAGGRAYCDRMPIESDSRSLYISIEKTTRDGAPRKNVCSREAGTLERRASIEDLFHLLDVALRRIASISMATGACVFCIGKRLSGREKEVIFYLRLGVNQTQAAKYMQLSVKTVHTYKQSVMRKLDFRGRNELFSWLLKV